MGSHHGEAGEAMTSQIATSALPEYDPYAYQIHEDPYPTYRWLREQAPVYFNPERNFYALSRHDDVMGGFKDSELLSSAEGVSLDPSASGPHAHRTMSFLAMDPPRHGRMRSLVSRGFTPRRVAELEPRIRSMAVELWNSALEVQEFDLIDQVAGRLPMDVISELIGVPQADRARLRELADLLVHREEGVLDVPPAGVEAAFELVGYYGEMIAARRHEPTDDLTSALIDAEIDGDRLSDDEILGFLFLMVVAGNETTTKLLANAWFWADHFGDQKRRALDAVVSVEDWVEETLRFDTSSQMLARVATRSFELHGEVVPQGARVLLLVGSANRDDRVFADPDSYLPGRSDIAKNLASFGFGRHFCLGASLARLEARVVLDEARKRIVDFEVDAGAATRVHSVNVRGFATLPTSIKAR